MISATDLYWNYFPLFHPKGVNNFVNRYLSDKVGVEAKTVREYYYCECNGDFYLLDKALCNFYKFNLSVVERVMKYGRIDGFVYLISKEEMDGIDYRLGNGYGKAFIFVDVVDAGVVSACVYFIGEKQRLMNLLKG